MSRDSKGGDDSNGSFATDRCAPKIALCPLFPESDAKSEPWHLSGFAGMNGDWFNGGANLNSSRSRV
jgi:hypothetical protein